MATYYFDSSAMVKWYAVETGTRWVNDILSVPDDNDVHTVEVTGVEVVAALTLRVRTGGMTADEARAAISQFRADFSRRFSRIGVTESLVESAMTLAEKHGLRGYDAVQLAAALTVQDALLLSALPSLTFVSADQRLNTVAAVEGLAVEDPNDHV